MIDNDDDEVIFDPKWVENYYKRETRIMHVIYLCIFGTFASIVLLIDFYICNFL